MTTWMVSGRAGGKSEALLRWLADGEPARDGGWSRVVVTSSVRMRDHLIERAERMTGRAMADQILLPGVGMFALAPIGSADRLRRYPEVEVAVDDAEAVLASLLELRRLPEVVAGLGVAARPRVPRDGGATTIEQLPGQGEPVPEQVREKYRGVPG